MSLGHSSNIITNGLVFYYDKGNTKKSFLGQPTTNQIALPTPDSSSNVSFPVQGTGTFKRITSGTFGGYTIQGSDVIYRYDLGGVGCHYHGNSFAIGAGQYLTFSFDYYVSPDAQNYPTNNTLANIENYGGSALGGYVYVPNNNQGVWQTVKQTFGPTTASGTQAVFLYPGGCSSSYLASSGYILFKNPQVELLSYSTPYVSTSRAATASAKDLMGNITLDVSNTVFDASGNPTFNGTNGYINSTANIGSYLNSRGFTLEAVVKHNSIGGASDGRSYISNWSNYNTADQRGFILRTYANHTYPSLWWCWGAGTSTYDAVYANTMTLTIGQYYHVVGTYEKGVAARIYVNGVLMNSTTGITINNDIVYDTTNGLRIGHSPINNSYMDGDIPIAKIYDRPLSADEISQNFTAIRKRFGI